MNENVENLIESFKPATSEVEAGDECVYREGIFSAKVEVMEKKQKGDWLEYVIRPIEVLSPKFLVGQMSKPFDIGKKDGYGYCGWTLKKI
jgi:hypothetical protein